MGQMYMITTVGCTQWMVETIQSSLKEKDCHVYVYTYAYVRIFPINLLGFIVRGSFF